MKYILYYVEHASPKLVQFNALEDMEAFMSKFKKTHKGNEDCCLEFSFMGEVIAAYDPYWLKTEEIEFN